TPVKLLSLVRFITCSANREAARKRSFPNDFVFKVSKIEIAKQIGNAVSPLLAARYVTTFTTCSVIEIVDVRPPWLLELLYMCSGPSHISFLNARRTSYAEGFSSGCRTDIRLID